MEIFITIIGTLIAGIALFFQLRKGRIAKFKGCIGIANNDDKNTGQFTRFIYKNEAKVVHLDIYFDDDKNYEVDKEGIFYFSYYDDINNKLLGGHDFRITISENDDFFFDNRHSSKRLTGYFKIIGFSGPQQGWFTTLMKPVKIESI